MKIQIKTLTIFLCSLTITSTGLHAGKPDTPGQIVKTSTHQFSMKANINRHGRKIYSETEFIVRFKNNVSQVAGTQMVTQYAGQTKKTFGKNNRYKLITLKPGQSLDQAMARFKSDPNVAYVSRDYYVYPAATPTAGGFYTTNQWNLNNTGQTIFTVPGDIGEDINAESAWDIVNNCSSVTVAVLDTGIDYGHPDLAANMITTNMADFIDDDNDPRPGTGSGATETHGTHVTGIIAAIHNDGAGIAGVCWGVKVLPIRVLTTAGGSSTDLISGIDHAIAQGANVINMSLVLGGDIQPVRDALERARAAGIVVVVAAGNEGINVDTAPAMSFTYPCRNTHANIICVAAVNNTFGLADFGGGEGSNFGTTSVDVAAPGRYIYSTTGTTSYSWFSGTSQATPHVAGLAAMLLTYNPTFTYTDIVNAIRNGGTNVTLLNSVIASGNVINARQSLEYVNTPRGVSAVVAP